VSTTDPRTIVTQPGVHRGGRSRDDLEHYLRPTHFPARIDQLLSTLARHRAPSRLYWQLASLPLSSAFESLPELLAALDGQTPGGQQPEPI
jgi:hypothetical protein